MNSRLRSGVAPAYLFACLVLGGSAQGIWQNMVLQLAGLALLAWAAAHERADPLPLFARQILIIAIAAVVIVGLQLVPIPWALWSEIGPRREIAAGYQLLGLRPNVQPLSLTPYQGLASLLSIIPGLAIFCSIVRLNAYRAQWMAVALIGATLTGIIVGIQQVGSPTRFSPWYFYPQTNFGTAVGFFANANHMGTLLVCSLPFLAALGALPKGRNEQAYAFRVASTVGGGLLVLLGIVLNGSFAAYTLALPVLAASALIVFRGSMRTRLLGCAGAIMLFVGSLIVLQVTPIGTQILSESATTSVEARQETFSTTLKAVGDFFPWGSGLGSFRNVYYLYEDPIKAPRKYAVHAHNDYLEIALESGVAGIILIMLFIGCWAAAVWGVWRTPEAGPFPRAAVIASAAILVHSIVDFPLRTEAIAACFGMFIALMAKPRVIPPMDTGDLRAARHVTIM